MHGISTVLKEEIYNIEKSLHTPQTGSLQGRRVSRDLSACQKAGIAFVATTAIATSVKAADAGPVTEIICMGLCSAGAMVNPTLYLFWAQCMQVCLLTGLAPTP